MKSVIFEYNLNCKGMESMLLKLKGAGQIGIKEFLQLFNQFSKEEQLKIAEKIASQTFADQWAVLDEELLDTEEITEAEVVNEVRAVRYGKKEAS